MLNGYAAKIVEIPAFASLSSGLRTTLAEVLMTIGRPRVLGPSETLYKEGAEDANTGAVLIEGTLAVSAHDGAAIRVTAPDLLGEMQQFDDYGQRTATVTALGPATVLEFSWHEFVARVRDTPMIGREDQKRIKLALESYASRRLHQL